MVRMRLARAALALALYLSLAAAPSQAILGSRTSGAGLAAANLLVRIEGWWHLLSGRQARPANGEKGCGIDPNGMPVCQPGDGDGTSPAEPAPPTPAGAS